MSAAAHAVVVAMRNLWPHGWQPIDDEIVILALDKFVAERIVSLTPRAGAEPEAIVSAPFEATPAVTNGVDGGGRTAGSIPATGANALHDELVAALREVIAAWEDKGGMGTLYNMQRAIPFARTALAKAAENHAVISP